MTSIKNIKKEAKSLEKKETVAKKWMDFEILKIIDYLADNRNFEVNIKRIISWKLFNNFFSLDTNCTSLLQEIFGRF